MNPLGPQQILAIEKAEAPPPDGSTARKKCCVFFRGSRAEYSSSGACLDNISAISRCANAFSEPSAEIPSDSRRSIAGSSARSLRTTSTCKTPTESATNSAVAIYYHETDLGTRQPAGHGGELVPTLFWVVAEKALVCAQSSMVSIAKKRMGF
jgi:hypothetical protein